MRRDENPYSKTSSKVIKTIPPEGFPDGPVVKNPLGNAGDTGSILGNIPHTAEQLSPGAANTEPVLESPGAAITEAHAP